MTINDAMQYAAKKAASYGYKYAEFKAFELDLKEMLYQIEDLTQDEVDKLIEEVF